MTKNELAALVLRVTAERCDAAERAPRPKQWQQWALQDWLSDRERGPRFSCPQWFGAAAGTDSRRIRLLRMIHGLASSGLLVVVKGDGGRVSRVSITKAGRDALAEIEAESKPATKAAK